ncbi:MAG: LysR family transcriptional regulator substrate-binding protein, partial [Oscillospiraceae bacterium]|nr:LysR family transcriptional regulator substrate-binding protein [Oscillospiraceae bacterium]
GPVPLSQLDGLPLALYRKGSSHNTLVRRSFARAGIEPNIRFELDQLYAIRELVLRGHAAAFLDPDLFRDVPSVRFHEIASPGFSVSVYLVYRRETELLRLVLRCMRQYFSSTISSGGGRG